MLSLGQATFGRCSRLIPQKLLCWTRKQWTVVDITHFIQTVVTFRGIKKFYDKSNTPLPKDSYSWETKYYRGWSFRSFLKVSKSFQNIFRKQFLCWYGRAALNIRWRTRKSNSAANFLLFIFGHTHRHNVNQTWKQNSPFPSPFPTSSEVGPEVGLVVKLARWLPLPRS